VFSVTPYFNPSSISSAPPAAASAWWQRLRRRKGIGGNNPFLPVESGTDCAGGEQLLTDEAVEKILAILISHKLKQKDMMRDEIRLNALALEY